MPGDTGTNLRVDVADERLLPLRLSRAGRRLGLARRGFGRVQLGVGRTGGGLDRSRVPLEQEVPRLDERALRVVLTLQMPGDAGTNLRVDVADERPDIL